MKTRQAFQRPIKAVSASAPSYKYQSGGCQRERVDPRIRAASVLKSYYGPLLFALLWMLLPFGSVIAATYEYDDLHRLTSVVYDNGGAISYVYDNLGNRITLLSIPPDDVLPPVYVDKDNDSGTEDGASWATAYISIQAGIDNALRDVWVAEGTYYESVTLRSVVRIFGGFDGTETGRSQRDIQANSTIIDASTADVGAPADHVVFLDRVSFSAVDGITITGGYADGSAPGHSGGGIYCTQSDNTNAIRNCLIRNNWASGGGGIYMVNSSVAVEHCEIRENVTTGYGGGLRLINSSPHIHDTTIIGNSAETTGGGLQIHGTSAKPLVTYSRIVSNSSDYTGGGVGISTGASPRFENCAFYDNSAGSNGAALAIGVDASGVVTHCVIVNNSPGLFGGGIYCGQTSTAQVFNSILTDNGNYAAYEGEIGSDISTLNCLFNGNASGTFYDEGSTPYSTATDLNAGVPEASSNIDGDPAFLDPASGDFHVGFNSAAINTGTSSAPAGDDIDGESRPFGIRPDIGIDEFVDSDGDQLPDYKENEIGSNSGDSDSDDDGLGDYEEVYVHGTNPNDADSDNDGLNDYDEAITYGTDPNEGDSDDDSLSDYEEVITYGTNPNEGDSDGDGLSDFDEINVHGTDPNDADSDDDGFSDNAEVNRGSDPHNPNDYPIYYVDLDATGSGTGLSWSDAFTTIQPAINAGYSMGGGEVWVAAGVYSETRSSIVHPAPDNVNTGSVVLKSTVYVYGGFAGTEAVRSERDWKNNVTTLDGLTARGGLPAFHVIVGADDSTIDGFTISGGGFHEGGWNTTDSGGGMYNRDVSPTISNCIFTNNTTHYSAGMVNFGSASPTVTNCTFTSNTTTWHGGGMGNWDSASPNVTDCTFTGNSAAHGGGMSNWTGTVPMVINCMFFGNSATGDGGGGVFNWTSSGTFTNCLFAENIGTFGGGMGNRWSNPLLTNCTIAMNTADTGSGIQNRDSAPTLINCIVRENFGDDINNQSNSSPTFAYSNVPSGYSGEGTTNDSPLFVDPSNGVFHLRTGSPSIDTATSTGAPSIDILGITRPQGPGIDMGVYEYVDADADGLSDAEESYLYGTDPLDSDSDTDGLNDGDEVNTYSTDPNDSDSDTDGLNDGDEVNTYSTDPNDSDSDDDGLTDGAEVDTHGTDPNDSDSDDDGLTDGAEVDTHGTDPNDSNSDGDEATDGEEISGGTDPNDPDVYPGSTQDVWVESGFNDANPGTFTQPVGTIAQGVFLVPNGGNVKIRAGNYPQPIIINGNMSLRARNGTVRIGDVAGKTGGAPDKWSFTDWLRSMLDIFSDESEGEVYPESESGD